MDIKKLQKFNKEEELKTENNASGFVAGLFKGIGNIFSSAIQMEKDGISEHIILSQIEGKTRNGKKLKMQSAIRTRIGLGNFINRDVKSRGVEPRGGHATLRGDHVALRDKSK